MKIAYDVPVPHNQYGAGRYSKSFWNFYESEHDTVRFEFSSKDESMKAYRSIYGIIQRKRLVDVKLTRIESSIYLQKVGAE